ncbi:MAG: heme biosynthesis HemY N-terminal domain-containing protein [Pseudomonadales bacterium]
MLRLFIICLIALAFAIGLSLLVLRDPGYILISYADSSIEANLWAAVTALVLVLAVVYFLLRTLLQVRYSGRSLQQWLQGRDARRSEAQLTAGLIEYIEGNWKRSLKTFSKGAESSPTPLFNYLMAARASEALGEDEQCAEYLKKAEETTPDANVAIGLTQAEIQLKNNQLEDCLATLTRLRTLAPEHPQALRMLVEVNQQLGDWRGLQELLPQLRKQKVLNAGALEQLEFDVYKGLLVASGKDATPLSAITTHWESTPKVLKKDPRLVGIYARALTAAEAEAQAEKVLRSQLQKNWDADLVRFYGTVQGEDAHKQLIAAERWLQERPNDADLLLTLGRLSLMNELWGKAREYFTMSINITPNEQAYGELGRLLSHLGESQQSYDSFHQGLMLSTNGLPTLPQPVKEISATS